MGALSKEIEKAIAGIRKLEIRVGESTKAELTAWAALHARRKALETLLKDFPYLDHPACLHVEEMADMIRDLQHRYHFDADCKEACYGICMDAKALLQKIKEA